MDINNYRPISVLNTVSKILERHVHTSLYAFMCKYDLLTPYQSGFRSGYSCESCLMNMTNYWFDEINNGNIIGVVALDLSKAFDVLSHDIILKKLEAYGCGAVAMSWFKSYLKNRRQYVNINETKSEILYQRHGVPQGSILGPLIFSIFMNDVPLILKYSKIDLYADDSSLYFSGLSIDIIERKLSHDLVCFENWCKNNNLFINTRKSKCMVVCTRKRRSVLKYPMLNLKLKNGTLECVTELSILGLCIDHNLCWSSHINNLCVKLSSILGLLWRIKQYMSHEMKINFYNAFILSRIDYCLSIWGGASKVLMNKLYRIQKRAARIILNAKIDTSSRKLFNILDWMTIFQRVNFNRCIIMFKILNGYMPVNLRKYFIAKCLNSHNLRSCLSSQHIFIPLVKTDLVKNSFLYNGPFLWNHLPDEVLNVTSLSHFKHMCKIHCLM